MIRTCNNIPIYEPGLVAVVAEQEIENVFSQLM
jgi:hypothetical protein